MPSRRALLCLLLATLVPTSCGGPRLRVGDFVLEATAPTGSGEEILYYRASVFNDGPSDVDGGWARIVGPVAGATVIDGVLVFGAAPAGEASSGGQFRVRHPAGAPFDPASLQWAIVAGVFDFDADGLSDGEEADRGLASDLGDTDGDGVEDGAEVLFGALPAHPGNRPNDFPLSVFYALGERRPGEPAIALVDSGSLFDPMFLGRPGGGPAGFAFDRHGFLFAARGSELVRIDPFSGAIERSVTLLHSTGAPAHVTRIAVDPATNRLHGVENDPATGAPTTTLLTIDPATGLVEGTGSPLPIAPAAIAFHPEVDPVDGRRQLHLLPAGPAGETSLRVMQFPDGGTWTQLHGRGPIDAMAFEEQGSLVTAHRRAATTTEIVGGAWVGGLFPYAFEGLAIPPSCPAPCFGAPKFAADTGAVAVALGDLDGDGDLDAVSGEYSPVDAVGVLRNDGTGSFALESAVPLPNQVARVALARIDGDALLDAAAVTYAGEVFLLRGDGAGGLLPAELVGQLPWGGALVAGDVTGDGAADLVGPDGVLFNDGAGGFTPGWTHPFLDARGNVALADVDGDGRLDVLALTLSPPHDVASFTFDGAGGFQETSRRSVGFRASEVAAGDVDADGRADAVVSGEGIEFGAGLALLRGSPAGLGAAEALPTSSSWSSIDVTNPAVGDVTGDGLDDVVLNTCYQTVDVLVGDRGPLRSALFPALGGLCGSPAAIGDVDGNGLRDVVVSGGALLVVRSFPGAPGP